MIKVENMNSTSFACTLKQKARRSGGDRYTTGDDDFYVPQSLSRKNNQPLEKLMILITDTTVSSSCQKLNLERRARRSGGDLYTNANWKIYLPQELRTYDEVWIIVVEDEPDEPVSPAPSTVAPSSPAPAPAPISEPSPVPKKSTIRLKKSILPKTS